MGDGIPDWVRKLPQELPRNMGRLCYGLGDFSLEQEMLVGEAFCSRGQVIAT